MSKEDTSGPPIGRRDAIKIIGKVLSFVTLGGAARLLTGCKPVEPRYEYLPGQPYLSQVDAMRAASTKAAEEFANAKQTGVAQKNATVESKEVDSNTEAGLDKEEELKLRKMEEKLYGTMRALDEHIKSVNIIRRSSSFKVGENGVNVRSLPTSYIPNIDPVGSMEYGRQFSADYRVTVEYDDNRGLEVWLKLLGHEQDFYVNFSNAKGYSVTEIPNQ